MSKIKIPGIRSAIADAIKVRTLDFIEKRSSLKNPPYWLLKMMGNQSHSGVSVSESNAENVPSYYACRLLISNTVSMIPLGVRQKDKTGNKIIDTDHPIHYLISKKPNPFQTSLMWLSAIVQNVIDTGNSVSVITRNAMGMAIELGRPLPSNDAKAFLFKDPESGRESLWYRITGYKLPIPAGDVLHFRNPIISGKSGDDQLNGKSILTAAKESLGFAIVEQEYGSKTYKNGGGERPVIMSNNKLEENTKRNIRNNVHKQLNGEDGTFGDSLVLEAGLTLGKFGMNPSDADFINSKEFSQREICQFFGMFQPTKIGINTNSSYNSLEQQSIAFVTDTMMPWFVQFEQELNDKLFSTRFDAGRFTKFNVNGLLRGDSAARTSLYKGLYNLSAITPNEIRALEDMNPMPKDEGGETFYIMQNMIPIKDLGEVMKIKYAPKNTNTEPKNPKE